MFNYVQKIGMTAHYQLSNVNSNLLIKFECIFVRFKCITSTFKT